MCILIKPLDQHYEYSSVSSAEPDRKTGLIHFWGEKDQGPIPRQ